MWGVEYVFDCCLGVAMMVSLCLLYLFMDSVLVVFRFCFGMLVLKVVYVGR